MASAKEALLQVRDRVVFNLAVRSQLPKVAIWGNCQSYGLQRTLLSDPDFCKKFSLLRLPPVHEITPMELRRLRAALPQVDFFVTQNIRENYRGLGLGTSDLLQFCRADAKVVRIPTVYFRGHHPFLCYVRPSSATSVPQMPVTGDYHDLRAIAGAAAALGFATAGPGDQRKIHQRTYFESLEELKRRDETLDVVVADIFAHDGRRTNLLHTINHPANRLLSELANRIASRLGATFTPRPGMREWLGDIRLVDDAPANTHAASGHWDSPDQAYSISQVIELHKAVYRDNPRLLKHAMKTHLSEMVDFGLVTN